MGLKPTLTQDANVESYDTRWPPTVILKSHLFVCFRKAGARRGDGGGEKERDRSSISVHFPNYQSGQNRTAAHRSQKVLLGPLQGTGIQRLGPSFTALINRVLDQKWSH